MLTTEPRPCESASDTTRDALLAVLAAISEDPHVRDFSDAFETLRRRLVHGRGYDDQLSLAFLGVQAVVDERLSKDGR